MGGIKELKDRIFQVKSLLDASPQRPPSREVKAWLKQMCHLYDVAVKSSIGMPTYSDSVTLQSEAPKDIPTLPLDGYQLLQRTCYITKLASSGTTAGGFYAELKASDLVPFVGTNSPFRVSKVTSWTVNRADSSLNSGFAGVSVPLSSGSTGTEVLPIWSENWTPIGQGYAGITTTYPLGDYPLYTSIDTTIILSHFTALGGTGGPTGVPVVFHATIEYLV